MERLLEYLMTLPPGLNADATCAGEMLCRAASQVYNVHMCIDNLYVPVYVQCKSSAGELLCRAASQVYVVCNMYTHVHIHIHMYVHIHI